MQICTIEKYFVTLHPNLKLTIMKKNYNTPATEDMSYKLDQNIMVPVGSSPYGGEFDAPARGGVSPVIQD